MYIRTKDGIYEVKETRDIFYEIETDIYSGEVRKKNYGNCINPPKQYITKNGIFYDEDIIKQADTIEELCDEAVAVYPDGTHDNCSVMHIVDNNGFCEAVYGCLSVSVDDLKKKYECWEIYGAIWTNKGLIYVAKMNENGELVLL